MNKDFGAFELGERIGKGAMAMVYLAVQKSLQRRVVLKILYPHLADDAKLIQRFEREARAAAMLKHENIVQVIDFGRQDDMPFIAMEFVEGSDLRRWLDEHGTPPVEIALLMLCDICRGLEHAHSQGIVHRDIKPANVMFTIDGMLKIMDFGLARTSSESATQMTVAGSVLGTPAYMSPEQAMGEPSDARSDIFSTGVLAYELLGGQRPFTGDTYSGVMRSILTVEPPALSSCNPLVPEEAVRLIQGMLQKDVSKRTAKVTQVREGLEDLIDQMNLRRSRALLTEYAHAPAKVTEILRNRRVSKHLDQGLYYETMGLSKIDDALAEYRRVLHLDPSHAVAKEHVKKLERERLAPSPPVEHAEEVTQVFPPPAPAGSAARPERPPAAGRAAKQPAAGGKTGKLDRGTGPAGAPGSKRHPLLTAFRTGFAKLAALPLPLRAAAALGVVLVVIVLAMLLRRGPSTTNAEPPGGQSNAAITPVTDTVPAVPAVSAVPAEAAPLLDTLNSLQHARIAADSSRWDLVLAWADSSKHDTSLSKKWKQKREIRELEARAQAGRGDTARAQGIYASLIKADTNFRLTPKWLTARDSAAYGAARHKVIAAMTVQAVAAKGSGMSAPPPAAVATGFVLITANPASSLLIDGHPQGTGELAAIRVELATGPHFVVLSNTKETRSFPTQVSAGATALVTYDPAGDGAALEMKDSDPPGGFITLDGHQIGPTPFTLTGLAPGKHVLVGELNGRRGEKTITLKPKKKATAKLNLR